jgi:hypothetical protein
VPIPLRLLLAAQPKLVTPVPQVVHRVITRLLVTRAGVNADNADSGAITLIQRIGFASNLNIHLHCLALDGVYRHGTDGVLAFVETLAPTDEEPLAVLHKIIARTMVSPAGGWLGDGNSAASVTTNTSNAISTAGPTACRNTATTSDTTSIGSMQKPSNDARHVALSCRTRVFDVKAAKTPEPKQGPDDPMGLAYRLLKVEPAAPAIRTGHEDGVIVINVAEADDDHREAQRVRLGEPQRTLLGHLRHETAHYLQYRWIADTAAMPSCRDRFGDETADYAQALAHHYAEGPPADWSQHFISPYTSSHPWEDWAETCAHYLLVVDAVQTAASWGLQLSGHLSAAPHDTDLNAPSGVQHLMLEQWLPVAQFLNAMNRSLGLLDSYPFQMPAAVLGRPRSSRAPKVRAGLRRCRRRCHPDWRIDNLAVNGARFSDVVQQLENATGRHDLVLILAGGNDVIRLTGEAALRGQIEQAVALASRQADTVVLMPLRRRRSRALHLCTVVLADQQPFEAPARADGRCGRPHRQPLCSAAEAPRDRPLHDGPRAHERRRWPTPE